MTGQIYRRVNRRQSKTTTTPVVRGMSQGIVLWQILFVLSHTSIMNAHILLNNGHATGRVVRTFSRHFNEPPFYLVAAGSHLELLEINSYFLSVYSYGLDDGLLELLKGKPGWASLVGIVFS